MSGQMALDLAGVLTAEHVTTYTIPARREDRTGSLVLTRCHGGWTARTAGQIGPVIDRYGLRASLITERGGWTWNSGRKGYWPTAEDALVAAIAAGVEVLA